MKKNTLLLFILLSVPAFSQDSDMKIYLEKKETISIDQYDLIKQVNIFYPDIMISKEVKNNYKNNLKVNELLSSDLIYGDKEKYKYRSYSVTILDKRTLSYSFVSSEGMLVFGDVRVFDGNTVRTLYRLFQDKTTIQYFINGKLVNELKG